MLGRRHNLKSARLRARRRKIIIGQTALIFIFLAGLWVLIFWSSGLSSINIRTIEVSGTSFVSSNEVAADAKKSLVGRYFFTVPKTNIFFYPKSDIEKNIIEAFPAVQSVSVGFKNFHTIGIWLLERQAEALWCEPAEPAAGSAGSCYLLDANGLIFAPFSAVGTTSPAFIKFYSAAPKKNPIGQIYAAAEYFQSLLAFAKNLNTLGFAVSSFSEGSEGDFEAKLFKGVRLIISRDIDLDSVLNNFQTIVSDPPFIASGGLAKVDYIDLRFGDKVFYKKK